MRQVGDKLFGVEEETDFRWNREDKDIMTNREVWIDITDYEGLYQVSNLGRVKRVETQHILTQSKTSKYYSVVLCKSGKLKGFNVHRLVAIAFVTNVNNYPCVNHKDEETTNNIAENLEWCTYTYNMNYGTVQQRISQTQSKPVKQKTKCGKTVGEFASALQAQKETGINNANIRQCVCGNRKTAGGFVWEKGV